MLKATSSVAHVFKAQRSTRPLLSLISTLGLMWVCVPLTAQAFCGFFVSGADSALYNDATQVALMRKGNRTVMTMSNTYKGPTEDFAMVVPVPVVLQEKQVKTLSAEVFDRIDQLSAPRLVEYWEEDPCARRIIRRARAGGKTRSMRKPSSRRSRSTSYGVTVEAEFTAGEYMIVILSAQEANGLERWLVDHQYKIPDGASEALRPYIQRGMKFFVAKVDITKVKRDDEGVVTLSPLRFDFESKELRLPVRLGLLNASAKQDLIVYILSPNQRYEVANYPNAFIPTNLEVENEVRSYFGSFYTRLFEEVLERSEGSAVVTEYAWQTSSCDPCPTPPLTNSELYTLGGDVLTDRGKGSKEAARPKRRGRRSRRRPPRGGVFLPRGAFSSWVLTRLHTRYSKESLSEDLVFRPTYAVAGGRGSGGISTEKPGEVKRASSNQFQGRYIIRHYWQGKVECANPRYGRWGGPPNGSTKRVSAGKIARAKASEVALSRVVRSPLKQLKLKGKKRVKRKGER